MVMESVALIVKVPASFEPLVLVLIHAPSVSVNFPTFTSMSPPRPVLPSLGWACMNPSSITVCVHRMDCRGSAKSNHMTLVHFQGSVRCAHESPPLAVRAHGARYEGQANGAPVRISCGLI